MLIKRFNQDLREYIHACNCASSAYLLYNLIISNARWSHSHFSLIWYLLTDVFLQVAILKLLFSNNYFSCIKQLFLIKHYKNYNIYIYIYIFIYIHIVCLPVKYSGFFQYIPKINICVKEVRIQCNCFFKMMDC